MMAVAKKKRKKYPSYYQHPKDRFGPWVYTRKSPRRYGLVNDWTGDGPYEVQFVLDGSTIKLSGGELELVTQKDFEKWEASNAKRIAAVT